MRRRRSSSSLRQPSPAPGEAVVIARARPAARRRRAPRAGSRPGRHHRHPGAHGLQRREAEALVEGGDRPARWPATAAPPARVATQPVRTIRSRAPCRGNGRVEGLLAPARRAGEDEGDVGVGAATARRHGPGPGGPSGARPSRWPGRSARSRREEAAQHRRRPRLGGRRQRRDAGVDDADAGRVGPEGLHDLVGHEGGVGVDPCARSRARRISSG